MQNLDYKGRWKRLPNQAFNRADSNFDAAILVKSTTIRQSANP
jgi:hypothetical protein